MLDQSTIQQLTEQERASLIYRMIKNTKRSSGGCLEWQRSTLNSGYGQIKLFSRKLTLTTHRVSYELFVAPVPPGLFVCHHCDNKICVSPSHLFCGTPKENTQDMMRKGRGSKPPTLIGERHSRSVLTADDVREIRTRYASGGLTQQALASEYRVSKSAIKHILRGRVWKEVYHDAG